MHRSIAASLLALPLLLPVASQAQTLTIHQFLQTVQSVGSPQMACRQV
jgi:hypothetical protein